MTLSKLLISMCLNLSIYMIRDTRPFSYSGLKMRLNNICENTHRTAHIWIAFNAQLIRLLSKTQRNICECRGLHVIREGLLKALLAFAEGSRLAIFLSMNRPMELKPSTRVCFSTYTYVCSFSLAFLLIQKQNLVLLLTSRRNFTTVIKLVIFVDYTEHLGTPREDHFSQHTIVCSSSSFPFSSFPFSRFSTFFISPPLPAPLYPSPLSFPFLSSFSYFYFPPFSFLLSCPPLLPPRLLPFLLALHLFPSLLHCFHFSLLFHLPFYPPSSLPSTLYLPRFLPGVLPFYFSSSGLIKVFSFLIKASLSVRKKKSEKYFLLIIGPKVPLEIKYPSDLQTWLVGHDTLGSIWKPGPASSSGSESKDQHRGLEWHLYGVCQNIFILIQEDLDFSPNSITC